MMLDKQTTFSDAQALTASAASTNRLDFGASARLGSGHTVWLYLKIDATGGSSPTIAIALRGDTDSTAGSEVPLIEILDAATLSPDPSHFAIPVGVFQKLRYYDVYYTLTGTSPTYTVTCALLLDSPPTSDELVYETIV
jgi:hypothetical protein